MSFTGGDVAHLLLALGLLLASAHALGHIFVLCRQPRVIGEITGGLLLGPTLLGAAFPSLEARIFPPDGPTASWLGGTYQLGLMLLMFASGAEMRSLFRRGEGRTVGVVTFTGVALPSSRELDCSASWTLPPCWVKQAIRPLCFWSLRWRSQ